MSADSQAGTALLHCAKEVLSRAEFNVEIDSLNQPGTRWLLAENEFFVLGVVAGNSLQALQQVESIASEELIRRVGQRAEASKRWDLYLVLLARDAITSEESRDQNEFIYNTRGLRRIAGLGMVPSTDGTFDEAVEGVLRPFLPLDDPVVGTLQNPLDALVQALELNGIDPAMAKKAVDEFHEGEDEGDV